MDPVVARYLREQADALRRHEDGVRADAPDSVHQARVAVRRIRSALRVFAADEPEAGELGGRFREWGRVLGRARDAEVVRELLRARASAIIADDGGATAVTGLAHRLDRRLAEEYEHARTAVVGLLDTPGHAALLADLDRLVARADDGDPGVPAPERARRLVEAARAARRRYRRRERKAEQRSGADADVAWHAARRAAKRARYAAELVADSVPDGPAREARDHAEDLKEVQSHLGERQDGVALRSWLERERARAASDGEDTAAFDALLRRGSADPPDEISRGL